MSKPSSDHEWSCFATADRFWCVRRWSSGVETWFGSVGTKGRVHAIVDENPARALEELVASKTKKGYAPVATPTAPPTDRKVKKAREGALLAIDPRHRGHRKVANAWADDAPDRLRRIFEAGEADPMVAELRRSGEDEAPWPELFHAAHAGSPAVVRVFLEHGADPRTVVDGTTALHVACSAGRLENVELLLQFGADTKARDREGRTALMAAVDGFADAEVVRRLVARGAEIDVTDGEGASLLHLAINRGMGDVAKVEALLAVGAPIDARDDEGRTPLDLCRAHLRASGRGGWARIEELLVAAGGSTATLGPGRDELLRLIDRLPRVSSRARHVPETLSDAAARGDVELVQAFLADGADPDEDYRDGYYPLQRARRAGHQAVVELLLARGAAERPAPTPFFDPATQAKLVDAARTLMETVVPGFDVSAPDGPTLEASPTERVVARCAALISERAVGDLRSLRVGHDTALAWASEHGWLPIVRALLDAGADPHGPDDQVTPLTVAARQGWQDIVRALLEAGADPSVSHDDRFTPLTEASARGDLELVKILVGAGADLSFAGVAAQTVFNTAKGPERNAIRRYLRDAARERIERSKRYGVKLQRRKKMHSEPERRHGTHEYDAYFPRNLVAGVRAPIEEVAWALESAHSYERDVAKKSLVGITRGCFVFQMAFGDWTLFAPIGSPRRLVTTIDGLTSTLGCDGFVRRREPERLTRHPSGEVQLAGDFFERERLWIPPFYVEGEGLYDAGDVNVLVLTGLRREHIGRVDRVVFAI